MVILDVAIVNVALPSIKSDLGFSSEGLQWVITAYAILFGGTLLLGGRLADLLGRRRMFVAGLGLFPLRPRLVVELSRRLPRRAGSGWSAARARCACAADDDVRRGPRAQPRARDLRRRLG
jgi:MFS family permease